MNTVVFTLEMWFSMLLLTEFINIGPKSKMIGLHFVLKIFISHVEMYCAEFTVSVPPPIKEFGEKACLYHIYDIWN